jgi:C1A family cysteine protease
MIARYGWLPDLPDHRDLRLVLPPRAEPLPASTDLRIGFPPVYDQTTSNSCGGNSISATVAYDRAQERDPSFIPSRSFIYYNARVIEGTADNDSGMMIRDGIKACADTGVCSEVDWPFDVTAITTRPSPQAFANAAQCKIVEYMRVDQTLDGLKGCLAAGFPIVFGFTVYESFESTAVAQTGKVSMPGWFERSVGGHAVVACGYTDNDSMFIVRNSWGPDWGDHGYFWLPYDYLTNNNLSDDFWTIRTTSS